MREIMAAMCETELFQVVSPGSKWIFDPFGAAPDELTGRINKGHAVCVSVPHMSHSSNHHRMYGCMCMCITQCMTR